ncbi:ABC transporter ATP-binding protein [Pseudooceanicola sp. MF1-13]|uniref:ABC transporter ATP-binding protein n=1 Tax=Pseudooceanicola sp. MF1-13 TaxID=3379095 RepID=UPI0038919D5B
MSEAGVALELSGLSKSFGSLVVTKDVSLTVAEGAAVGIIGPNGAGKTTLFNLITGTLRPNAGSVTMFGRDISAIDSRQRCHMGIARSFQVPQPFSGLTTFENVLVAAAFGRGIREATAREPANEALARCGMAHKADVLAGSLTLLDRKRLELARALATDPKILLLDEIAGGLTEAECRQLIALIKEIHASGVTIVWIEHVLHALLSVVDEVIVLDFGEVIATGPADEVMKNPKVAAVYLGPDADEPQEAAHV